MAVGGSSEEDTVEQHERESIDAWRALVSVHDLLMKTFQAELKRDFALTVPQYDALLRLSLEPRRSVRMSEVAEAMLYSSGAATKVFDRLVDRGLVERTTDPGDKRAVAVRLTAQGKQLIRRAKVAHGASIAREVGPFASATERRHVMAFLRRVAGQD